MPSFLQKTFGGLSGQYYFRHFVFGLAIAAFVFFMSTQGDETLSTGKIFFIAISTFLYPYSRFVYENIVGFIMGGNAFFGNALVFLVVKFFTMLLCWFFAVFIAPLGLGYLYYHHSKVAGD